MKDAFACVNRTVNLRNWAVNLRKRTVLHQDLLKIGNLLKADAADYIMEKKEKILMIKIYLCPRQTMV